jgi:beta-lactamase regulating signal transducer with metallopeptidase domain
MGELIFPAAAVAATFLLVIPALTLVSRAALAWRRRRARSWADFGGGSTFALLVAPVALPVTWLVSASLHQAEPGNELARCLVEHVAQNTCLDAAVLLGSLLLGLGSYALWRAWREHPRLHLRALPREHELSQRVRRLCAPHLPWGARVVVTESATVPVFTVGWLRPRVILGACFVRRADDEMIEAALLHELAHVQGWDNARGFLARLCLGVNPLGRLLEPELAHWRNAREAHCDGIAVAQGGQPLALAQSLLRAARFQCQGCSAATSALCGYDATTLKLRVALLMDGPQAPSAGRGHLWLPGALALALILPHLGDQGALEHFHYAVEHLLHISH